MASKIQRSLSAALGKESEPRSGEASSSRTPAAMPAGPSDLMGPRGAFLLRGPARVFTQNAITIENRDDFHKLTEISLVNRGVELDFQAKKLLNFIDPFIKKSPFDTKNYALFRASEQFVEKTTNFLKDFHPLPAALKSAHQARINKIFDNYILFNGLCLENFPDNDERHRTSSSRFKSGEADSNKLDEEISKDFKKSQSFILNISKSLAALEGVPHWMEGGLLLDKWKNRDHMAQFLYKKSRVIDICLTSESLSYALSDVGASGYIPPDIYSIFKDLSHSSKNIKDKKIILEVLADYNEYSLTTLQFQNIKEFIREYESAASELSKLNIHEWDDTDSAKGKALRLENALYEHANSWKATKQLVAMGWLKVKKPDESLKSGSPKSRSKAEDVLQSANAALIIQLNPQKPATSSLQLARDCGMDVSDIEAALDNAQPIWAHEQLRQAFNPRPLDEALKSLNALLKKKKLDRGVQDAASALRAKLSKQLSRLSPLQKQIDLEEARAIRRLERPQALHLQRMITLQQIDRVTAPRRLPCDGDDEHLNKGRLFEMELYFKSDAADEEQDLWVLHLHIATLKDAITPAECAELPRKEFTGAHIKRGSDRNRGATYEAAMRARHREDGNPFFRGVHRAEIDEDLLKQLRYLSTAQQPGESLPA